MSILKLRFLFSGLFVVVWLQFYSQDVHFSQFFNSPLSLNPAKTGDYDGEWRFMNNYRRQWGTFTNPGNPYKTISVGIDKPFSVKRNSIALGLYIINDVSGDSKLTANKIFANVAFHKKINKNYINIGVQGGYVMKNYMGDKLTFPNQFDNTNGNFNSGLNSGETTLGEQLQYIDVNAGISWSAKFRKIEPEIGFSAFHVNMPNESYTDNSYKLPIREIIHAGAKCLVSKKIFVFPNLMFMNHSNANDALAGANVGYMIINEASKIKNIYTGVYFRDGIKRNYDSFIWVIGANLYHFDVGISYDFNISELKEATNYRGGFEISIIYTAPSTKLTQISIPCDRF